jgi:hypothetical protein
MKRQIKVRYLSPDHLKYINPSLIDSFILKNGSMVKLNSPQKNSQYFYRKGQNQGFNTYCGQSKYRGQARNIYGSTYVFRGGKKKVNELGANKIEIEVPEGGVEKEGLLTDVLTGGGYNPEDDPYANQGYYGDEQKEGILQISPNPEENPSNDGYSQPNSYYPNGPNTTTNLDDAIRYPSSNPQGAQEDYEEPNLPNTGYPPQDYPQQPEEQIPIPTPYVPLQPTPQQPEYPIQEPVVPIQPTQPYQQPSQPQYDPYSYQPQQQPQPQYDPYPNQQPMQPIAPPLVIPASNAAKTNAPVQQGNNNTAAPKSFKELFKEAKKQARDKIKKNNVFRARRKEVQEDEFCPYCNSSEMTYPYYYGDNNNA